MAEVQARKVLVCDDDIDRVRAWKTRIEATLGDSFVVDSLEPVAFARAVRALGERLKQAKSGEIRATSDDASVFDACEVLILDSDLTPDPSANPGADPEGEVDQNLAGQIGSDVARLARAHTGVGSIVVVNERFKRRTFDLTMVRWATSPADVYVTHEDIDSEGLWHGTSSNDTFRPWHWPNLSTLGPSIESFLEGVTLGSSLLEALQLDESDAPAFSFRQVEALKPDVDSAIDITLEDVALSESFGIGLQPKEKSSPDLMLRVAVYGLRRWLERLVLPAQNVLIDLPHLLQERPWLSANRGDETLLNEVGDRWTTTNPATAPEAHNAGASAVLGRAVWTVSRLPIVNSADRLRPDDLVFCEDTSRFSPPDAAQDFASDIDASYNTRFVAKLDDVDYSPRNRLFE